MPLSPFSPAIITDLLEALHSQVPILELSKYTVRVINSTSTTFDEVVIFYKNKSLNGVVFLHKVGLIPNEVYDFEFSFCYLMESYVIGFFIGEDLVAQLPGPGQGNMTPERASQLDPSDIDKCVDSWEIYEG